MANPIRVLIVDDSVVIRKLLASVIGTQEDMFVCATAANGMMAINEVSVTKPDVITMDLDMPKMNGLETVRALRREGSTVSIIMVSSITTTGARMTLDCLNAGADDFITKPHQLNDFSQCLTILEHELIPKIRVMARRKKMPDLSAFSKPVAPKPIAVPVPKITKPEFEPPRKTGHCRALLVASSTGGPLALNIFFDSLGSRVQVPIFVVQHMPPYFTRTLAERLDEIFPLHFKECTHGERVKGGCVYIAEGGKHMEVKADENGVIVQTNDNPMVNFCKPAADVLFSSAVDVYGGDLVAVVLTGMGRDGTQGSRLVVNAGGKVVVQDEMSSVVWGMPGSVVQSGLAHAILPIDRIADKVVELIK